MIRNTSAALSLFSVLLFIGCGGEKPPQPAKKTGQPGPAITKNSPEPSTDQETDLPEQTEPQTSKKILSTVAGDFPVRRKNPKTGKEWEILGIMTDGHNFDKAKANAEDTLTNHPDLVAMVGLWAYNPPKILQAVSDANKLGEIKVIGFDEDSDTLRAIEDGTCEGTIVQNPYAFGFRSVEYLAALARGQEVKVPANQIMFIPTRVITKENVEAFKDEVQAMRDGKGPELEHGEYNTENKAKVGFLTNSIDPFWELAQRGCERAAPFFNAEVKVLMPPTGQVEEQKRMMEEQITLGTQGLAISPIDPANQAEMINATCAKMKVITQDSDAPNTDRLFYLGTDNYSAGRQAGELTTKVCPDGGKVMIFVGKMEVLNAQERSQGVIDVLLGQ
ncbi:MAG: substrate-binding domain-containing protein [Planctomycetota bacterium]|nr:substrate-binding domain-containing protein [Planctomycetota bacterium]